LSSEGGTRTRTSRPRPGALPDNRSTPARRRMVGRGCSRVRADRQTALPLELPVPRGPGRGSNPHLSLYGCDNRHAPARSLGVSRRGRVRAIRMAGSNRLGVQITGPLRPATSGPGGSCTHDVVSASSAGATTPTRSARADLLLRAHASPVVHDRGKSFVRERRPRRSRGGGSPESRTSASIST
jgi:hypothetical protein